MPIRTMRIQAVPAMVSSLIAFCISGAALTRAPSPDPVQVAASDLQARAEEQQRQLWKEALDDFARTEDIAVAFDVNIKSSVPTGYKKRLGVEGARRLALTTGRRYKDEGGVQLFVRELGGIMPNSLRPIYHLANFLNGLSPELIDRISGDGLPLSLIPKEKTDFLRYLCTSNPTMSSGGLVSDWDGAVLKLGTQMSISQVTENGRKTSAGVYQREVPGLPTDEMIARAFRGRSDAVTLIPFSGQPTGALKFKTGELLKLKDLVKMAEEQFETTYVFDSRLSESEVYLRGEFSVHTINLVLKELTTVAVIRDVPEGLKPPKDVLKDLLEGPLASVSAKVMSDFVDGDLKFRDLANGKSGRLEDLLRGNKRSLDIIGDRMDRNGLATLEAYLTFNILKLGTVKRNGQDARDWVGGVPSKFGGY